MKKSLVIKFLSILLIITLSKFETANASKNRFDDPHLDYIILTCSGSLNLQGGSVNRTDNFWQDIELVFTKDKTLKLFGIVGASHWYNRSDSPDIVSWSKSSIRAEKGYKKMDSGSQRIEQIENLSLASGRYSGKIEFKTTSGLRGLASYDAKCNGTEELLAYLNNNRDDNNDPKISDNEIIPASSGTGFFITNRGHIITNYHVIEGCTQVNAIYNGSELASNTLAVDKINDLAIIKIDIRPKKIFKISNEDATLLENVIVAGYPLGKKVSASIKATSGTITSLSGIGDNFSEFQTDAALNSGNSGGPIINEYGNVIGVAVSKIQQEGVESFNFGIKSSVLKTFTRANNINLLPPNNSEMKKKDLGSLITEATIYLDCWMTGKQIKKILAQKNTSQKAFYSQFLN